MLVFSLSSVKRNKRSVLCISGEVYVVVYTARLFYYVQVINGMQCIAVVSHCTICWMGVSLRN